MRGKKRFFCGVGVEPRSVLDSRRSPSPPTSTSTLSSSLGSGGAGVPGMSGNPAGVGRNEEEWGPPLGGGVVLENTVPVSLDKCGFGVEEWDSVLCGATPTPLSADGFGAHPSFLSCIVADSDELVVPPVKMEFDNGGVFDPYFLGFPFLPGTEDVNANVDGASNIGGNNINPSFASLLPVSVPPTMSSYQENSSEKSTVLFPNNVVSNHQPQQNPSFLLPEHPLLPPADPAVTFSDFGHGLFQTHHHPFRRSTYVANPWQHDQRNRDQDLFDLLLKAAELVEIGNSVFAFEILARLNHLLISDKTPQHRSAFFFKEVLCSILADNLNPPLPATPMDVLLKISAYKSFSEMSPILQFTNFTSIQTILEDIAGYDDVHIIDFDIGVGGQWSSFLQELSQRHSSTTTAAAAPSLTITAVISCPSHYPIELTLAHDTLSHLAGTLKIPFQLTVMNIESLLNPTTLQSLLAGPKTAIAVSIPVSLIHTSIPEFLHIIKQLSPTIVVSIDTGCDRSDLPFSQHFLHAFHSHTALLESVDAAFTTIGTGGNQDIPRKIEKLIAQPRIVNSILNRRQHRGPEDKSIPWRTLFALYGFVTQPFSNFTETQADCLLKRVHVEGFHAEKRQSSLVLFWHGDELSSVTAWRCH